MSKPIFSLSATQAELLRELKRRGASNVDHRYPPANALVGLGLAAFVPYPGPEGGLMLRITELGRRARVKVSGATE